MSQEEMKETADAMDATAGCMGLLTAALFPVVLVYQVLLCLITGHHYWDNQRLRRFLNLVMVAEVLVCVAVLLGAGWYFLAKKLNKME
jgi:TRAP-type C4-dicarboxylate transport system permease small subunit